jgi:hypothetical protein
MASELENRLRESMGIVCTSLKFKTWRFLRGVAVVVAVLLLCLGFSLTLLFLLARGPQDPSAFGMANVQSVDQRANGNAPPLEGSYYLFALAEEADDDPVNAGLLTMLFLAASFFGASLGWLHTKAQGQGALCLCSLGVGEVLGRVREDYLPFLEGVMNLAEKPHQDADCSVSSVHRRSLVFRMRKPFLSEFITPSRSVAENPGSERGDRVANTRRTTNREYAHVWR